MFGPFLNICSTVREQRMLSVCVRACVQMCRWTPWHLPAVWLAHFAWPKRVFVYICGNRVALGQSPACIQVQAMARCHLAKPKAMVVVLFSLWQKHGVQLPALLYKQPVCPPCLPAKYRSFYIKHKHIYKPRTVKM